MLENDSNKTVNNDKFALLKLPALINFYQFTEIPKFEDTEERKKLLEDTKSWEKKENIEYKVKLGRFFTIIVIAIIGYFIYSKIQLVLLIALLIVLLIGYIFFIKKTNLILKKYRNTAPEKQPINENKEHANYLGAVLKILQTNYLNNFRIFEFDNWGFLFYSKLGCACIDLISGQMLLYAKENIKDVLLEHVHLGTTTTSNAYTSASMNRGIIFDFHYTQHSNTRIDTSSVQHYEWHLDILTDFIDYPKLSFRFADNTKGVDEAKIIYGILKP
jgi:uncharacterized membrane protein YbaN (DUF454 family)